MNNEEILDRIGDILEACGAEILQYTPQLYEIPGEVDDYETSQIAENEPIASSVLLEIKDSYFLVTAGHVFNRKIKNNIGFLVDQHIYFIMGDLKFADVSEGGLANKIDIAVLKLSTHVVESIKLKYKFLSFDRIAFDHQTDDTPKYLVVGYPIKTSKINKITKKIKPKPLIFITGIAEGKDYKRLHFDPTINFLVKYRQKKVKNFTNKSIETHASPRGISGCGVWYLPSFINPDGGLPNYQIMGIVIEQSEDKTILIGTRIHILTELIRRDFGLDLPKSNITRLA